MFVNRKPHSHPARRAVALLTLLAFGAAACADDKDDAATVTTVTPTSSPEAAATTTTPLPMGDIVATALTNQVFTELAGLAVDAGLVQALRGGPFTVFAPTDAAFAKLPLPILHYVQDQEAETGLLTTVLKHHIVEGAITPEQLAAGELTSLAGTTLAVTEVGGQFYVEGHLVGAGVEATNGYVYVMDDVMVPALGDIIDVATTLPGFETLAALVTQAELIETLKGDGPFTVFAPHDSAFEKVPQAILDTVAGDAATLATVLTYHVVPGALTTDMLVEGPLMTVAGVKLTVTKVDGVTYVDGNAIAVSNVRATNGVIHVLTDVMVPPLGDIIDVATTLPGFGTLASLVTQAGLIETLKGEGPFTVFAPVDTAFDDLPTATLNAVLADPELLKTVLTYHVVAGKLTTDMLVEGKLMTVAGVELTVTKVDGVTYIDGNPIV
ncbi:MAG: fasciclin domain-containing protein, partial [Actinomycetota bacterium]|nr:fasciclin domain-containing protein [Actinomycetota bacterium]